MYVVIQNMWYMYMCNQMKIIAHRGASKLCEENTIGAFLKASSVRAHGIEMDIQITSDDVLVVKHDTFDKNTGEFTYNAKYDKSIHTSFEDVINITQGKFEKYFLDVKDIRCDSNVIRRLVYCLLLYNLPLDSYIIASFNEFHLRDVCREEKRLGITIPKAYSTGNMDLDMIQPKIDKWAITNAIIYKFQINKEFVEHLNSQGVQVYAYTCNTNALADYCRSCGCSGIITDVPENF